MNSLFWDISLEIVAMEYASKCIKSHNTNRHLDILSYKSISRFSFTNTMFLGESWYSTNMKISQNNILPLLNGINWFFDEIIYYNYSTIFQSIAGHYSQIVWANTRYIGCGFANCHFGTLLVCNYWPRMSYIYISYIIILYNYLNIFSWKYSWSISISTIN